MCWSCQHCHALVLADGGGRHLALWFASSTTLGILGAHGETHHLEVQDHNRHIFEHAGMVVNLVQDAFDPAETAAAPCRDDSTPPQRVADVVPKPRSRLAVNLRRFPCS
jgi:hypothetical protein